MRVTIYQPRYFPQLHYFNRMIDADVFVFLDTAQYTKSLRQRIADGEKRTPSFQSDTPIKLPHGTYLLTVPIRHNGYSPLNTIKIDYSQQWWIKHTAVMKASYHKAEKFPDVFPGIKSLLSLQFITLASLNIMTTMWALSYIYNFPLDLPSLTVENINKYLEKEKNIRLKKVILGSQLEVERPEGMQKGTEWTTAICKKLGATEYFHGGTAQENYMDVDYYKHHGITPIMQNWKCHEYPQLFSQKVSFLPNMSIIDLLCNVGKREAQQVISSTGAV